MSTETIDLKLKKDTVKTIQSYFKTKRPEEALDKLAEWLRDITEEVDFMKKHQSKGHFKKTYE